MCGIRRERWHAGAPRRRPRLAWFRRGFHSPRPHVPAALPRSSPMNRRELVAALAERTETDRRAADAALQAFIDTVTETVASGEPVAITGFAKFARVDRAARMGRNPQTGEPIRIKASRRVRVTALKAFKDAVLTGRPAKKAPAKKTTAKETTAKSTSARAAAKKAPAKKATAKKTTARKTVARKTTATKSPARKATRR